MRRKEITSRNRVVKEAIIPNGGDAGELFAADMEDRAILLLQDNKTHTRVTEYEGNKFMGPSCVKMGASGDIFITDSGRMGEGSFAVPCGSLFQITTSDKLLRPLAYETLANPRGLAIAQDGNIM